MEDLENRVGFFGDALQEGGADAVGGGVALGVGLDGNADVEAGGVVFQVGGEVVGVDGVTDVGGDEEAVGVALSDEVRAVGVGGKGFGDAPDGAGEEVTTGTLAEERTDFFVVKKAHDLEDTAFVA